jgi:hypothetical protein
MSMMWSGYRELGLDIVSIEKKYYCTPKKLPMAGENKGGGIGYPFKKNLEKSLE